MIRLTKTRRRRKQKRLSKIYDGLLYLNSKQGRAYILIFAIVLFFSLIVAKAYQLQIVHGQYFKSKSMAQNLGYSVDFFDRGLIYFKDKGDSVAVAGIQKYYELALSPSVIPASKHEPIYSKLSEIIEIDKARFNKIMSKKDDPYEILKKQISAQQAEQIRKLGIKGIILTEKQKRVYPAQDVASHVIGFLAHNQNEELAGMYGLEKYYDDELQYSKNAARKNLFAFLFSDESISRAQKSDLVSTIHLPVQKFVEDTLDKLKEHYNAEFAAAIIMDSKTGKIIAMTHRPGFDLNNFGKYDPHNYPNKLVERVYEMGSIVKPLTMAAGLDAGVVKRYSTYNDKGYTVSGKHTIYNFDKRGRGANTTMQQVISESLNTGVVHVMRLLGKDKFRQYFIDFGLTEETGIDLPYESMNLIDNILSGREIEYATASFGQGIALTPISMTRAFNVLGTGKLVQPHVVETIKRGLFETHKNYDYTQKRVIKPETALTISQMLVHNVDNDLAKGKYKLDSYSVAAKTGTAQIANKNQGGYLEGEVLHTFAGYFPAYDPQYTILLMLMKPQGVNYASETLPKTFFDIVEFLINYFEIPPDR